MEVEVNVWAVLLAAAASMAVGGIWYAQGVFGRTWGKLAGIKMDGKVTAGNMAGLLSVQFVLSVITAFVLAHFMLLSQNFFDVGWTSTAINTAFWAWLGFTATRLLTHDMFEKRRKKLTLLNAAHELVTLEAMALVIAWLHP